jgi:hypothetical protein
MPGASRRGVFLSYRRDDAGPYARSLQLQLSQRIPDAPIFMDLDSIEPGLDFAEVIEGAVNSSAVLVALIGRQWATLTDQAGVRRLDNPDDYVRFEVKTALERGVRVIPVLVDGAKPLRQQDLPAELHKLARLNAHKLSYDRYQDDAGRLLDLVQRVLAAVGEEPPPERERGLPAFHPQPLRYYLYISDAKLDMLFDQIPQSVLEFISAEVEVDLKVASVTLRQADNPDPTRAAKLKIVERFIDSYHHVGAIEEPGNEYFRGQMDMQWGWLQDRAVWFQGNDFGHAQCVALGGSRRHVLGEQSNRDLEYPFEATSLLVSVIKVINEAAAGIKHQDPNEELPDWAEIIYQDGLLGFTGIPKQRLDFLAIPLAEAQVRVPKERLDMMGIPVAEAQTRKPGVHVVLGTPLYIALAR